MRINFDEIKILCDIDACAVIYSPFNSIPEIWPPNSEVHKVIEKFEILTEEEQTEASVNHEEFLTQTITKDEKVKRLTEDNNDKLIHEGTTLVLMVTWEIWLWTIAWPAMRFGGV